MEAGSLSFEPFRKMKNPILFDERFHLRRQVIPTNFIVLASLNQKQQHQILKIVTKSPMIIDII